MGATADDVESQPDNPPSYEEAIKSEAPPPPYYMVVPETCIPSTSTHSSHAKGHCSLKTPAGYTNAISLDLPNVTRTQEGITSPFLNNITSSEGLCTSTTASSVPQDPCTSTPTPPSLPQGPVDVIRAPILREASRVLAPTHLSSPATRAAPGLP